MTRYVKLEKEDFFKLVSGEEVEKKNSGEPVKIILADIGWDQMLKSLSEAIDKTAGGQVEK